MKVIHVLNTNKFSGAENVACVIISLLRKQGIDAYYCSPDGPIRQALEERNIPFLPISSLSVSEIRKIIREQKPDILHAHDPRASVICAFSSFSLPVISHMHNNDENTSKISVKSLAYQLSSVRFRHIFWVSESAQNGYVFRKFVQKKSSLLRNIIDMEAVQTKASAMIPSTTYDVIYVGRLEYQKDPLRLLKVEAKVHSLLPFARFAIIGTGSMENQTRSEAERLGLSHCVDFLGYQSNPLPYVKTSKLMIMTSRFEGLPMCALEAQALGVPIVSTPTDGLKEIIANEKNGFLSNNDDELVQKICGLLINDRMQLFYSNESFLFSQAFHNSDEYIQSILSIYWKNINK